MGNLLTISFSLFCLLSITTCTHRWVAHPQGVPGYERCDIWKDDIQMLKIPGFELSYIIVRDCFSAPREKVSIAMMVFLDVWKKHHSQFSYEEVEDQLNQTLVEFSDQTRLVNAYDRDGNYIQNASANGLTITKGMVWVKLQPGQLLCESSLAHELIHVAIWTNKKTDADPDHLGTKYAGWDQTKELVLQETNRRLCELGI